jgi:hypothetical protein
MTAFDEHNFGWERLKQTVGAKVLEIAESAVLGRFEPYPISSCYDDELPHVRRAISKGRSGQLVNFSSLVNRNAFLLGCLDYTQGKSEEHLLVGYGFRYGSTTKVAALHHVIGGAYSVGIPSNIAQAMQDHYRQDIQNELLILHNHPYNVLNLLLNNWPFPSWTDRRQLEHRALNPEQLLRALAGNGRMLFYLAENGAVKQFRLPTFLAR